MTYSPARSSAVLQFLLRIGDCLFVPFDGQLVHASLQTPRIIRIAISLIALHPQMRQQVVPLATLALLAEGRDVDWADDNFLAGTGVGLGKNAAVVIDDHAAARPAKGRV